ncbi:ATP-dependent RNA helicase DeaD [Geomicrobium halophilum]|uniref:ATP-dependent RNA helicase CshA n=1 Tax=Geomicrobium halophilum TaxID=549000 RepID=A0A841PY77_9BACL|nr:DEAD/DEAH box helicase [Geomicrobium halophilum]MBB6449242.1 ATP-dependent RNA helicase DeaD [Geomicrobium halophilum]
MNVFDDKKIKPEVKTAIKEMGFEEPSPIQEKAIPKVLEGKDVIGQAQTGTGKTAAFGIPLLTKLDESSRVQALVLTPTRELAIQVAGELQKLSNHLNVTTLPIYGGQSIGHQIKALKRGVQVVIGTPGRVQDHLRRKTLKLDQVNTLVLDEADEMLDMGFIEDIESILKQTNEDRQTMLFSATMPAPIRKLSRRYMHQPETVSISKSDVTAPSIEQIYFKVLERNKLESLCRVIDRYDPELAIVFCRTKKGVADLTEALQARGYFADGLHGDLNQSQRDAVMRRFRESDIEFLVATDVAARGLDVQNVSHVINYDIPQDPESYVHRIGRTGRAGKSGQALTLVTPREMKHLRSIEREIKMSLPTRDIPTIQEVVEKQQDAWRNQIVHVIDHSEETSIFDDLTNELLEQYRPQEVVDALLKMNYQTENNISEEGYHFGDTGGAKGMVRFFINVGRNVNMSPKILVQEIADAVGIPEKSVGKIDIFENFTFVEVPENVAPFVYEGLRHSRINGARVNLEPAKPRPKRDQRPSKATRS